MTFSSFSAYFLILFISTITPGPSMLLAVNHGVNHGISKSVYSGLGNLLGNLLMAIVSILGLGAILLASGLVFNIIKWAGILYLVFLGMKLIFEPLRTKQYMSIDCRFSDCKNKYQLFVNGFLIAIGNPKGILFFTALFPQFINNNSATTTGIVIIFATLGVVAFGCYMLYALFGVRLYKLFQSYSFRKLFNRMTGSIFIGTGIAIAFSKK